jgi:hypothetical protein
VLRGPRYVIDFKVGQSFVEAQGFSRHILRIRSRTSREMTGRPGWPAKAGAMPSYDGFRLDDAHRCAPVAPEAEETDPQETVARG